MKNRIIALLVAAFMALLAADDCAAQFSKMTISDYGVKSIVPESFTSVRGAVWLDVVNPMESFTVSGVQGKVYKNGVAFIQGSTEPFTVVNGASRVEISGRASLCPGASIWTVLGLLFFDPEDYSVDLSVTITMASGESRVVEKKDMPVTALLKLR